MVNVTCFGAAGSVTGSNYLIENSRGLKILVDCGLFQGDKETESRNWEEWGYDPKRIKNLVLTHAHIDHSGRIPKIVKDGFRGRIIASPPTVELCGVMLLDSGHVQEMDAEWRTRKNRRQARRDVVPLYTANDAQESLRYLVPTELDQIVDLEPGAKARLRNAGHILGSCILELWIEDEGKETKIVFSGDLGKHSQLIVDDPSAIMEADYLFIESTYGNRMHRSLEESKLELLDAIKYAASHNEKVIIPAFAVERTQEVLYVLGEFYRAGKLPEMPIYLDSPLAIKATEIFRNNKKYYDADALAIVGQGFDPFKMPNLKFTPTAKDSMQINQLQGPGIVISANGMCTAGRIKHHLKHNLWRPGASIVIVGFQAEGSTGRQIVDGARTVTIFGEKVAVRAKVFTIGGFSCHADQAGLLEWVGHFADKSRPRVFVTHGEPAASRSLAEAIRAQFGLEVSVPRRREVLKLDRRELMPEAIPEPVPAEDLRQNMLTLTAELEAEIARLRERLATNGKKISQDDLKKLGTIREALEGIV
ncbi:MAG: MBL fold metallo-hydrolase [Desulfomonile tiedjei]|uniref:MBL fold metallo-hydrolase n=1 Tax=Desulfomonile tiedjei TaxID=2358 RepID=A0A9D6V677_9BACT|nr:MBL fold metallo-hydrolase [Desulfomonile tiedjei]